MSGFEYRRILESAGRYDVIVAGSGPSGLCAAVAAARMGANVALIERYGVLGGNLTSGHVGPILGTVGVGTLRDELLEKLGVPGNDMIGATGKVHDPEKAKRVVAQFVADEQSIEVLMQTAVADAILKDGAVRGLVIAGKEGLRSIFAPVVIDATGTGDVAAFAGAAFEEGRPSDALMQPVTLEFTINGVDESEGLACIGDIDDVKLGDERFLDYTKRLARAGCLPEELSAVRLHRTTVPGERRVNTTQLGRVNPTQTRALFPAEVALRGQIPVIVDFLRAHVPGYAHCRATGSATTLGIRESRRVRGLYTLTREDVVSGRKFDDVIVHDANFIVDIHNPLGSGQAEKAIQHVRPYDIPYRCLVPEQTDGLLIAGRAISGTHDAHASFRIMSVCMAMGQAAGIAAALVARSGLQPRELPVKAVQEALAAQGVHLFD